MKRYIIALLFSLASTLSYASIDTTGLSEDQIKELAAKAEQMKPSNPSKVVREELSEWGTLGKNMGEALISASKEVGVAVNEFSRTPVGIVTTAIIVYKIIGRDILKILFGLLWIVVGVTMSQRLYKGAYHYNTSAVQVPVLWGLWSYSKKVTHDKQLHKDSDGYFATSVIVLTVFLTIASIITMF